MKNINKICIVSSTKIYRLLLAICFIGVHLACQKESTSLVEEEQLDSLPTKFETIVSDINNGNYGDTHSLLVYLDGQLVVEEYFNGFSANDIHYQYSVTKSIASSLIGIAIHQGYIESVNENLLSFFPEYTDIQNNSEWKENITLKDVLTMRAGFQWDESTYPYDDHRNDANKLIRSDDMIRFMLDLPMENTPGSTYQYNSGCSMLLSGIIKNSTGSTVDEFARQHLFIPLEIETWNWETGNDGLYNTGWGLHLKPKDMLKIGQLYLNQGTWDIQNLLSENWIQASISDYGNNYGYQWWLSNSDQYSARGWGGQFIFVVPSKKLIMVTTAANFSNNSNPSGLTILNEILQLL